MQTPVKSGAQKRTRTHRHRVITDTWTGDKKEHEPGKLTHRLRNLGIASPFDLPKDPYFLLELFAIVLCRRIHFLSVKTSHYFQVISEPLNFTLRATRIIGQFEQIPKLARGIPRIATATPPPPYRSIGGEAPDVYIFHLRDISRKSLLGRSASTNRTGGPDNNQLSTLSENSGLYF